MVPSAPIAGDEYTILPVVNFHFWLPSGLIAYRLWSIRSDVDGAVGAHRRRGELHVIAGGELPLLAAVRIDRVQVVVIRADVDGAIGAHRRRRVHSIAGSELPLLATVRIDCVQVVSLPSRHRWCRRHPPPARKARHPPVANFHFWLTIGIDRVEVVVESSRRRWCRRRPPPARKPPASPVVNFHFWLPSGLTAYRW